MANRIPRVPVREQDPVTRASNFDEVCYGYNERGFAGSVQVPALQESALRFSLSCECKHT